MKLKHLLIQMSHDGSRSQGLHVICHVICDYTKNFQPITEKNLLRKTSESRHAMCAARPIIELAEPCSSAYWILYLKNGGYIN